MRAVTKPLGSGRNSRAASVPRRDAAKNLAAIGRSRTISIGAWPFAHQAKLGVALNGEDGFQLSEKVFLSKMTGIDYQTVDIVKRRISGLNKRGI
jgi:hypothetical protein